MTETSRRKDLTGQRFSRLVVLGFSGLDSGRNSMWAAICDCGVQKVVRGFSLTNGTIQSCGCLQVETVVEAKTTHGATNTPEYRVWRQMWQRCTNPNDPSFAAYSERKPPESWRKFEVFIADIGKRPSNKHTLERKDNKKAYGPDNCVWATRAEQNSNRSNTLKVETSQGVKPLTEVAKILGIPYSTALYQYKRNKLKRV